MAGPINFAVWQTQQAGTTVTETENVSVSEGADIETTNLSGISLSATVATGITFTSWTCTDFPGVGDLEFPNGTTAAAVEAGLSNPTNSATNLTVPGPGRYELTATWSDNSTETLSVRVVRPLPLAALTVTHGEVVTGSSAISETLSDTNGADITAPGAYSGALVEYPSGSTVSLTHDGNGGYTGTHPAASVNGLTLIWTATVTDDYGRSSTINKAQHMAGTGGAAGAAVTPPAPTSANAAFDGTLSNKTFAAFTDPDGRISSYAPSNVSTSGSPSWSGSGLGPYVPTVGNGEGGVLLLSALDSGGDTLATAAHAYLVDTEGPKDVVVAPADTSQHVASGVELSNKTFSAFTDTDSRIDNYVVENIQTNGTTTWSGTAPGPFTASSSAGDSGVFLLHARDASNNVLATAVHAYSRAAVGVGTVVAPADTTEDVLAGQSLSDHTFASFTDPNVLINNYLSEVIDITGTSSWSGSGLGPYSPSVDDGESGILLLHARDSSNSILATAVHGYSIGVTQEGSVQAPAVTTESVAANTSFSSHTFASFTDPTSLIASYTVQFANTAGTTSWTGTGLGPYSPSGSADGDSGVLSLQAKNAGGDILAVAIHSYSRSAGALAQAVVVAPSSTSQSVGSGVSISNKTFSAFTDTDGRIDNYQVNNVSNTGSASWSGSGLGPYSCTSSDGDSGVLLLNARDASNQVLATAVHVYGRASAATLPAEVVSPAGTSETVASGGSFAAKTFNAFTDTDSRISSYVVGNTAASGNTTWSGTGLGPYTASGSSDGDSGVLTLTAKDAFGGDLATAVHAYERETSSSGSWQQDFLVDFTGSDTLTMSSNGTFNLQKGGVTYETVVRNSNGSVNARYTAGSTGIVYTYQSGSSGHCGFSINMLGKFGMSIPAVLADFENDRCVQWLLTDVSWPNANAMRAHFGLSNGATAPLNNTSFVGGTLMDDGSNADLGIYSGSDLTLQGNTTKNTNYLWTVIYRGAIAEIWVTPGATSFADPRTGTYGPWLAFRSISSGSMPLKYSSAFYATAIGRRSIGFTINSIRGLTFK